MGKPIPIANAGEVMDAEGLVRHGRINKKDRDPGSAWSRLQGLARAHGCTDREIDEV
jgi:hypothetical protein